LSPGLTDEPDISHKTERDERRVIGRDTQES